MTSTKLTAVGAAVLTALVTVCVVRAQITAYQSAPSLLYTFDVSPSLSAMSVGNTNFTWTTSYNGHSGVAYFDGIGVAQSGHLPQFLDLYLFPDNNNRALPQTIGGEMSWEFWVNYASLQSNGHLLDIGSGTSGNIFISNGAFSDSNPTPNQFQYFSSAFVMECNFVLTPNLWTHWIVSVQQNNANDSVSATVTFYANTQVVPANSGYSNPAAYTLPPNQLRAEAWLSPICVGDSNRRRCVLQRLDRHVRLL